MVALFVQTVADSFFLGLQTRRAQERLSLRFQGAHARLEAHRLSVGLQMLQEQGGAQQCHHLVQIADPAFGMRQSRFSDGFEVVIVAFRLVLGGVVLGCDLTDFPECGFLYFGFSVCHRGKRFSNAASKDAE